MDKEIGIKLNPEQLEKCFYNAVLDAYKRQREEYKDNPNELVRRCLCGHTTKYSNHKPKSFNILKEEITARINLEIEEFVSDTDKYTIEQYKQVALELFEQIATNRDNLVDYIRGLNRNILADVFNKNPEEITSITEDNKIDITVDFYKNVFDNIKKALSGKKVILNEDIYIPEYPEFKKNPTSQLARHFNLYANADGDGESQGSISIKEKGNPQIYFNFNSDEVEISGRKLTKLDIKVHNAICSISGNGIKHFTADVVYKAMNNLPPEADIRGIDLTDIIKCIDYGMFRKITIDATAQLQKRLKDQNEYKLTGYFLPLLKLERKNKKGNPENIYRLLSTPPLFEYSGKLNQISSVPFALIDTSKHIKNSPEVRDFRDYLESRINWLKNGNKKANNNILYETILNECDIDISNLDKTQLKRKRDAIKKILTSYKEKSYIKDFTETKTGQKKIGISIEV